MQSFFRSLRLLWPYRVRLGLSLACVLVIAVLWGGGLGMMLPGMKILFSQEGLHGWAWNSLLQDKLNVTTVQRMIPAEVLIDGRDVTFVVDVVDVAKKGRAARAGLQVGDWLVGLDDGEPAHTVMRADVLARQLAQTSAGDERRLRVYNHYDRSVRALSVTFGGAGLGARLLGRVALAVPEPEDYEGRFPLLIWMLLVSLAMTWLRDLLRFAQEYLVSSAILAAAMDLRRKTFDIVLRLPTTFFARHGTSDTVSRFFADVNELTRGQITLAGKTLVEPAKAAASLAMALLFSWKLTLIAMIAGPPSYFLIRRFGRVMKRAARRTLESRAALLGVLTETLRGIRVVKAYTMETTERKRFYRVHRRLLKQQRRMVRIESATAPSIEALGITAGSGAAALAGWWVFRRQIPPELFLAWLACLVAMFDPVRKLAKVATRFQRADAAAERIFAVQDRETEKRVPNAPLLPRHAESIEFRHVHFRYPNAATDAVRDVSLTIHHDETVAIVGPNGSGKTTLVSLLPRLIDPTAGEVCIDGHNIADISLRSLRQQIAVVTQETVLFNATIAENIAYGLPHADDAAICDAARRAHVDEFVRHLPEAYDTIVGEQGATLSGGQRQRITIARAILRDPAILIFDEATSQIDADSEQRIHEAMEQFVHGRTTLMIAHRFATVMSADRIVVMAEGGILDVGTHDELLARCELYAHLYHTQFSATGG